MALPGMMTSGNSATPASRSSTETSGFSDKRDAITAPAEPAPTKKNYFIK